MADQQRGRMPAPDTDAVVAHLQGFTLEDSSSSPPLPFSIEEFEEENPWLAFSLKKLLQHHPENFALVHQNCVTPCVCAVYVKALAAAYSYVCRCYESGKCTFSEFDLVLLGSSIRNAERVGAKVDWLWQSVQQLTGAAVVPQVNNMQDDHGCGNY